MDAPNVMKLQGRIHRGGDFWFGLGTRVRDTKKHDPES